MIQVENGYPKRLKIYIAGPLTAETPEAEGENVRQAICAQIDVMCKGHIPFCPHLSWYVGQVAEEEGSVICDQDWYLQDLHWIDSCDALLWLGGSPGSRWEWAYAKKSGKPVYTSMDEIPLVVG